MTVNNEMSPNSIEFYKDQVARVVPLSGKIMDITHADTNEHSVALPTGYPANTKILIVMPQRVAGTGFFKALSTTGSASHWYTASGEGCVWIRAADGTFRYILTVANDDWDIHAVGRIEA